MTTHPVEHAARELTARCAGLAIEDARQIAWGALGAAHDRYVELALTTPLPESPSASDARRAVVEAIKALPPFDVPVESSADLVAAARGLRDAFAPPDEEHQAHSTEQWAAIARLEAALATVGSP